MLAVVSVLSIGWFASSPTTHAGDIELFAIGKILDHEQVGSNLPEPASTPYSFLVALMATTEDSINEATAYAPGGDSAPLSNDGTDWYIPDLDDEEYTDETTFSQEYPDGDYRIEVDTQNDGTVDKTLNISGSFPDAPYILDAQALQTLNPGREVTLRWRPWTDADADDLTRIEIARATGDGDETVYETILPDASTTEIVIPADTFNAGETYYVTLVFFRVSDTFDLSSRNGMPTGVAGYLGETDLRIDVPAAVTDLAVSNASASPTTADSGETVTLEVDVENVGTADVTDAQIEFRSGANMLGTTTVSLAAGASETVSKNAQFNTPGTHGAVHARVILAADANDTNNVAFTPAVDIDGGMTPTGVEMAVIGKGRQFQQTDADTVLETDEPWSVFASAMTEQTDTLSGADLVTPDGEAIAMVRYQTYWNLPEACQGEFATKDELDAAAPNGTYAFNLHQNTEVYGNTLALAGDAYPDTVPRLTNYNDLQAIDPDTPTTLEWKTWTEADAESVIRIEIVDADEEPVLAEPAMLSGSATSFNIPAGTLQSGRVYSIRLMFLQIVDSFDFGARRDIALPSGAAVYEHGLDAMLQTNPSWADLQPAVELFGGTDYGDPDNASDTTYRFEFEFEETGTSITSLTLEPPDAASWNAVTVDRILEENERTLPTDETLTTNVWYDEDEGVTEWELELSRTDTADALAPTGTYTLTIEFGDGSTNSTDLDFETYDATGSPLGDPVPTPSAEPEITGLDNHAMVTPGAHTVGWADATGTNSNLIILFIENASTWETLHEEFRDTLTADSVAPDFPVGTYLVNLLYANAYGAEGEEITTPDGLSLFVGRYTEVQQLLLVTDNPSVSLAPNWNLLGIFPETTQTLDQILGNGTRGTLYTGGLFRCDTSLPGFFQRTDGDVVPEAGTVYWVKTPSGGTTQPFNATMTGSNTFDLVPGWNCVAPAVHCPLPTHPNLNPVAYVWNADEQRYDHIHPGDLLQPGQAYLLFAHAAIDNFPLLQTD